MGSDGFQKSVQMLAICINVVSTPSSRQWPCPQTAILCGGFVQGQPQTFKVRYAMAAWTSKQHRKSKAQKVRNTSYNQKGKLRLQPKHVGLGVVYKNDES